MVFILLFYKLLFLFPITVLSIHTSDAIQSVTSSFKSRSPIALLAHDGFLNKDANWREIQPLDPVVPRIFFGLEWTWLIFNNVSSMPIRSNYHLSPKVDSSVFARRVNPRIKFVIWLESNTIKQLENLRYAGQFDLDIFTFLGRKSVLLEFFKTKLALSIRYKFGIITSDIREPINDPAVFLVDPTVFNHGEMQVSRNVPLFCDCINLNGYSLKVSANTLAPFIMYQKSGEITGGTNYMMLKYASIHYNLTLKWDIGLTRGNGKLLNNGSADGMLGDVLSGKADVAFIARLAKGQVGVIDLTECNSIDTLVFLTRSPEARLAWLAVIHIFTGDTWILIGFCFLAVIPVYYLSIKLMQEKKSSQVVEYGNQFSYSQLYNPERGGSHRATNPEYFYKACNIPFGLAFSQSIQHIPVQAYLISIFWMIFILNINTCYNSNLTTHLTSLNFDAVPQDFEALCQRLDYNISFNYINNGSCDCFQFFTESRSSTIIKIRERFMKNLEPDTGRCVLNSVLKQKSACIGWSSVTKMGIAKNATLYEGLNLVQISKSIHISLNSIGLKRHSIWTRSFSRFISGFRDMGIVAKLKDDAEAGERIKGKAWIHKNKDSDIYKVLNAIELDRRTLVRPFDIDNFSLSFLLLSFGLGISILTFVIEKLLNRKKTAWIIM
ncbi:Glutamate receptor ionotropic, delta-1 [Folsomia candida]|uniref:Glutamate receptor ionotropic, delta-1 n=1 Tax=Folsomia candida TaxID=158441 RepID=A0A226EKM3_FOLCA|nr:Glutamate receptor ionotropic, delta-1 [Folsomia candida]